MSRIYNISAEALTAYMNNNYLAETAIIGETSSGYIVKNGRKTQQIPKNNVESWALNNGFVAGQGLNAMSDMDRSILEGNMSKNTMRQKENASKEFGSKDETLQKFHDQKKETRIANAKHESNLRNLDAGVDLSQVALGGKSYSKGVKPTNQ